MMESLFAKAAQGRTFLQTAQLGALMGLLIQLSGGARRVKKWLGLLCDGGIVLLLTAAAGRILLSSGEGLRGYALLGLCTGAALYAWGLAPAGSWISRQGRRIVRNTKRTA